MDAVEVSGVRAHYQQLTMQKGIRIIEFFVYCWPALFIGDKTTL
jgi:hypothetical protein